MINKLIEQIGGRERLEELSSFRPSGSNTVNSASRDEWMTMARALLAVLDAKPVAYTHASEISNMHFTGLYIRGFPIDRRLNTEEGYTTPLYTAPPAASAPDRNQLRELVDMVWNEATESETVPSTADADRIIDKVFHGIVQEPASSRYQSAAPAPGGDGG